MSVPVEIAVTFTAEDLAITTRHVTRRRPKRFADLAAFAIFIVFAFFVNFILSPLKNLQGILQPRSISILLVIALIVVSFYLLRRRKFGFLAKRHFQKRIDRTPELQEEKTIRFSEAGVKWTERLSTTEIFWEAYTEIQETEDYLYFYTSERSAQIFPKRAFSEYDLEMLRLLLRSYLPPDRNLELFA